MAAGVVGIPVWAYLSRDKRTYKTLFPDVMPVSNDIAFTKSPDPKPEPAA